MESDQMLWDMLKSHIGHQVCIVANGDILWYTIGTLSGYMVPPSVSGER